MRGNLHRFIVFTWVIGSFHSCLLREATAATGWNDGFEGYTVGAFPNPPWVSSGNNQARIDNTVSFSGSNSFYLYGVVGSNWGSIAYNHLSVTAPFFIEFHLYNGSETLSGAHPYYGAVELKTGPDWHYAGRELISFGGDHRIHESFGGTDIGSFVSRTWYDVKIEYECVTTNSVSLSYWIDGTFRGSFGHSSISQESSLACLSISSQEGSAWFDDVSVTAIPEPFTFSLLALGGFPLLLWRRRK